MSTMNFSDYYDKHQEEINEGLLTALAGKLSTATKNLFRKRKGVNIAADFLKVFEPMPRAKYEESLNKYANAFTSGTKWPTSGKGKKVWIKDVRFGEVTGSLFGNLFVAKGAADIAGAAAGVIPGAQKKIAGTTPFEQQVIKKVPQAADPQDERDLYKSKEHQMDISVYLLSNGGKISLWNIPKTGTDADSKFDANKRVYALGMDAAATKAFELIWGMSYKNWLVTRQTAQETKEKEEADVAAATGKPAVINIDKATFNKLAPVAESRAMSFSQFISEAEVVKIIKKDGKWVSYANNKVEVNISEIAKKPNEYVAVDDKGMKDTDLSLDLKGEIDKYKQSQEEPVEEKPAEEELAKEKVADVTQAEVDKEQEKKTEPEPKPDEVKPAAPEEKPETPTEPKPTSPLENKLKQHGADDPKEISGEFEKGYVYTFQGQEGNLYVYKTNDGKYKLAYTPTLEDFLVSKNIIKKPVKGLK